MSQQQEAAPPSPDRAHLRAILHLGAPLVVNNLAYAGIGFADTVMAGQIGPEALAAVAVGSNALALLQLVGTGMMMALSPIVAHDYGAGRDASTGIHLRQALWIAVALSLLPLLFARVAEPAFHAVGTDPSIVPTAAKFAQAICFGVPAMFAAQALTYTSEGLGRTRPIMLMTVATLPVNVLLNWVFMFGHWGVPAFGAVGAGIASAITMWVALLFMLALMSQRSFARFRLFDRYDPPDPARLRAILKLGLPFTGSLLAEGSLFVGATFMVSTLGTLLVAAHQVALSYANLMFMIPAAFHSATTVRVGHMLGRGAHDEARRAGYTGIAFCVALMVVSACILLVARHPIADLYTDDPRVIELAASLLLLAGLFQISDGLQLGCNGALRGFQDARVPLLITAISYWGVGFVAAYVLGIARGGGAPGVWIGLIAGLTTAGVLLGWRYRVVSARPRPSHAAAQVQ